MVTKLKAHLSCYEIVSNFDKSRRLENQIENEFEKPQTLVTKLRTAEHRKERLKRNVQFRRIRDSIF